MFSHVFICTTFVLLLCYCALPVGGFPRRTLKGRVSVDLNTFFNQVYEKFHFILLLFKFFVERLSEPFISCLQMLCMQVLVYSIGRVKRWYEITEKVIKQENIQLWTTTMGFRRRTNCLITRK